MLYIIPLPLFALAICVVGLAMMPAFYFGQVLIGLAEASSWPLLGLFLKAVSVPLGFYLYGFSLMIVNPTVCFLLGAKLKPYRGSPVALKCIPWYIYGGLNFIARYSFLEFVTPTHYLNLYYKLMGMKIGRGVHINSTHISDPSMIELKDYATVGGSANIMAHYASGQFLIIAPVVIGRKAVIGAGSTIMGGVKIGDGAKVLANSFVLPKTEIPDGEIWGGVPAAKLDIHTKDSATNVMGSVEE